MPKLVYDIYLYHCDHSIFERINGAATDLEVKFVGDPSSTPRRVEIYGTAESLTAANLTLTDGKTWKRI